MNGSMPFVDIRSLAIDAVEEVASSYTVGIIAGTTQGAATCIGTGTAVEWRDRSFILTADHVIRQTDPANLWFLFKPEGTIRRQDVEDRSPGVRFLPRTKIDVLALACDSRADIALIEVSPNIRDAHNVNVFPLTANIEQPLSGTPVLVIGFPSALSESVDAASIAANRAMMYSRLLECRAFDSFDPTMNVALSYNFGESVPPSGVHPGGFSGSGVWCQNDRAGMVWTANPVLAGMVTTYWPRKRVVTGPRIDRICSIVAAIT